MNFHHPIRIEFNHCDPAGIVFYPRYFEMTNSTVETFFRVVVGHSYAAMVEHREGVPTARIESNFHAPARLGEVLDWQLTVTRLGTSSIGFHLEAHCDGTHRMTADLTLVFVAANGRPQPWRPAMRDRITAFMEAA
ncbi:MAG: thioesterase family protein [Paracoccaceae bacterium]